MATPDGPEAGPPEPLKYCPACDRVLLRRTDGDAVVFVCRNCGLEVRGGPEDTLIDAYGEEATDTGAYAVMLRNAGLDPTNLRVFRDCARCGRDYMTQLRLGDENVVYACACVDEVGLSDEEDGVDEGEPEAAGPPAAPEAAGGGAAGLEAAGGGAAGLEGAFEAIWLAE